MERWVLYGLALYLLLGFVVLMLGGLWVVERLLEQ